MELFLFQRCIVQCMITFEDHKQLKTEKIMPFNKFNTFHHISHKISTRNWQFKARMLKFTRYTVDIIHTQNIYFPNAP